MTGGNRRRPERPDPQLPAGRLLARLAPEDVLRRLELTIVRRLEGYLRGEHLGLLPGPGTDLAEARLYRPGEDDVRHMDWAVTARSTQPHVRDVVADRELETWVLVDLSASMEFGTEQIDKRDLAVAAVATVGVLTQKVGDRFGGFVYSAGQLRRFPARSGRTALFALVKAVLTAPVSRDGQGRHGDLGRALRAFAGASPRRGLRVVVSDFMDPVETWERSLRRLGMRHQVLAIEIRDPREDQLPDVGVVDLVDPETGAMMEADTSSPAVRHRFAAQAAARRSQVATALRRSGASHLVLSTDRDWVLDTARFVLHHRARGPVRAQGRRAG